MSSPGARAAAAAAAAGLLEDTGDGRSKSVRFSALYSSEILPLYGVRWQKYEVLQLN